MPYDGQEMAPRRMTAFLQPIDLFFSCAAMKTPWHRFSPLAHPRSWPVLRNVDAGCWPSLKMSTPFVCFLVTCTSGEFREIVSLGSDVNSVAYFGSFSIQLCFPIVHEFANRKVRFNEISVISIFVIIWSFQSYCFDIQLLYRYLILNVIKRLSR